MRFEPAPGWTPPKKERLEAKPVFEGNWSDKLKKAARMKPLEKPKTMEELAEEAHRRNVLGQKVVTQRSPGQSSPQTERSAGIPSTEALPPTKYAPGPETMESFDRNPEGLREEIALRDQLRESAEQERLAARAKLKKEINSSELEIESAPPTLPSSGVRKVAQEVLAAESKEVEAPPKTLRSGEAPPVQEPIEIRSGSGSERPKGSRHLPPYTHSIQQGRFDDSNEAA